MNVSLNLPQPMVFGGKISENWAKFKQHFQIYLEASEKHNKDDSVKIAIMLNVLGDQGIYIYNTFNYEGTEERGNFNTVLRKFDEFCRSRKNIVYNRFTFFSRLQGDNETIDNYFIELRSLALVCEFGSEMENLLRDMLVIGVVDKRIHVKLLNQYELDLNTALEMCRVHEANVKEEDRLKTIYDNAKLQDKNHYKKKRNKKVEACFGCGVNHKPRCTADRLTNKNNKKSTEETLSNNLTNQNNLDDNIKKPSRQSSAATEPKTCNQCKQVIQGGKCVQAMGVNWHEDHFVCKDCKTKLIGTQFMDLGGVPHCQKCYIAKHADKCKGCSKPIADKAIIALDAKWHQMCFRCSRCSKPIMKDQSFQVDAGKPHCVKC
ncbi:uncharacterized protein isoform X2 [Leptinotarsa decemlineata]|uniref:uncharacterized protein isoform X2 n=1 Tax=Leptinotarsa decemlineata TaxID=7539 RepID=UPI003D308737